MGDEAKLKQSKKPFAASDFVGSAIKTGLDSVTQTLSNPNIQLGEKLSVESEPNNIDDIGQTVPTKEEINEKLLGYASSVIYNINQRINKDKEFSIVNVKMKIDKTQEELKEIGLESNANYVYITDLFNSVLSDESDENLENVKEKLQDIVTELDSSQVVTSRSKVGNNEEEKSTAENEDEIVSTTAPVIDVNETATIGKKTYNVRGKLTKVKDIGSSETSNAKVLPFDLPNGSQIARYDTPRELKGGRKTRKSKKVKKSNSRKNPRKKSRKNLRRRSRRV